jgi:hypothetical protein
MRRASVAAVASALLLAGCPLPQPLPTYPAGTITPPRVLASTTTSGVNAIIPVPAGCATGPSYPLDATIFYQESVAVEARWFVDYRTDVAQRYAIQQSSQLAPNPDPTVLDRPVPPFAFQPYGYAAPAELGLGTVPTGAAGIVHVVELVVSNGFATSPGDAAQPNRTPGTTADGASQFEIQTYRWTFATVPEDPAATCTPGSIGCARCPP